MRAMKAIADATYGLIGRSPDHVAGLITGLAMNPALLDRLHSRFRREPHRATTSYARKNDLYISFAVTPPSGIRSREIFAGEARDDPTLQVIGGRRRRRHHLRHEDAGHRRGVRRRGLDRQSHRHRRQASRARASPARCRSTRPASRSGRASPTSATPATRPTIRFSFRFDETDTVLVCDRVKVPWERVFLHNNGAMSRRIYIETPANCYQNQQSNVRFWAKMGLIVGLASRMCQANGVDKIPAVRETLGRLAALEATIGGLVNGQIEACEQWPRRLRHAQPADHVCHASTGARSTTPRSSTRCARLRAASAADAGEHRPRRRSRTQGALRALVVDARRSTPSTVSSSTSSPGT